MPATIRFDFTHYLPSQDPNSTIVQLSSGQCIPNNFVIACVCTDLVPGKEYQITYQLLNPSSNRGNPINIFDPNIQNIFASFSTQKFATLADLEVQGEYILQATLKDIADDIRTSSVISLRCGEPSVPTPTPTNTPTVTPSRFSRQNNITVSIVDPDLAPIADNIISFASGVHEFPLVGLANNTIIGSKYSYEFFDVPAQSVSFEKKSGEFYSGSFLQNFNSKIALSGSPKFVFIYASVTDIENNITKYSEPTLMKYLGSGLECSTILPSGIDLKINAPAFRTCNARGITTDTISFISGGTNFSIGDKFTTVGGGGIGAELQMVSGGITKDSFSSFSGGTGFKIGDFLEVTGGEGSGGLIKITSGAITLDSITSLTGSVGFSVGDLLTTVGGGGSGAVIRVTSVDPVTGAITGFEVLNGGSDYTFAPSGLVAITGNGVVTNIAFNANNFSIPAAGGITQDSVSLSGGTGYNIGEILNIIGGGGVGAQVLIVSGALTASSINSLNGGTGYVVGDYLTTTGGNGEGVVIRVTSIGTNGAITGWEIVNGGHGFTGAPTGFIKLTGSGTGGTLLANTDNFAISDAGQITRESISGLINSGTGYVVGDRLIVSGGGGNGGLILITSVGPNGQILDYIIIDGGTGYDSAPVLVNESGNAILNQPVWNVNQFTDPGFVVINAGNGYYSAPTLLVSQNGNGTSTSAIYDVEQFTNYAFDIINSGSGYASAPNGLKVITGSGLDFTVSFNASHFTIPATGGLTPESIDMVGGTGYNVGDKISIQGGGGEGGVIQFISGSLTTDSISNILGGSSYAVGDLLTTTGGNGEGVIIRVKCVNGSGSIVTCQDGTAGWELINAGYGFTGAPTGLVVLTGSGAGASISANADNFAFTEIGGLTELALDISGGTGYNIGDIFSVSGAGGSGGLIQAVSGSLSTQSINSLLGGAGYVVGDLLTTTGGNGEGVVIRVTSIGPNGAITGWEIVNKGYGFIGAPTGLVVLTGSGSGATISANADNFSLTRSGEITKDSISGLIGSSNSPAFIVGSTLYITGGGGSGATILVTSVDGQGRILDYVIVDSGYGYDGSSSFIVKTGSVNGTAISSQPVFDDTKFTTTSFIILDQGSGYLENTPISISPVNNSNGNGASASLDSDLTTQRSFVIIDSGSGYTSEPNTLSNITGNGNGASTSFDVSKFSEPAVIVTNQGYGFLDSPTGLKVLTGYGSLSTLTTEFNDNNFLEISGPLPTPTPTPTITLTPTQSKPIPVPCNDLQSAGGQNDIYIGKVVRSAPVGQSFLICENSPALTNYTVVVGAGIPNDANIIAVENYYESVDDRSNFKKIILNRPITANVILDQEIKLVTVDMRLIKTSYAPGMMTLTYDSYSVPDRFKVIGIPVDVSKPELLLFDSGFRGDPDAICENSYVQNLSGIGAGYVDILKPDGMIYIRVIVEAPCEGTAWQYLLSCPVMLPPISITPTPTLTKSPTPTPTRSA
jgi:hypothetical protein